jgi:hypothetical protein
MGALTIKTETFAPGVVSARIPAGSLSIGTYCYDSQGILVARFHHYKTAKGDVIGQLDPKFLRISAEEFHLRKHGQPEPARLRNNEINRILGKTGIQARITYAYFCAERAKKVWKEYVIETLVKLGLKETRGLIIGAPFAFVVQCHR